jgi:periplasmic protein CpxP/Spy
VECVRSSIAYDESHGRVRDFCLMWQTIGIFMMMASSQTYLASMMKIKLIPLLAGLITLSAVATPLVVKAQDAPMPAQTTHQHHQDIWSQLNLTNQQKEQLRQIDNDTRTQMQAVFTPDQQAQMKAAMQNHQPGQGRRLGMAALNLSDAQKAKIKEIMQAQEARKQAILTPNQQQQLQQMHQQWQQMRQQHQDNQ